MGNLQLGDGAVGPGAMTPQQIAARKYLGDPNRAGELEKLVQDNTFSETNLMPGQRRLDSETSGLIDSKISRAERGPNERLAESMAGVDEGYRGIEVGNGLLGEADSLAMATPSDFNKALSGISKKRFETTYNDLKREKAFQGELAQNDERQSVAKQLARQEQLKMKNFAEQQNFVNQRKVLNEQIQTAKDAGRSSVLSGILGGLGAVGGFIVGGPGGAVAGGSIGSGVGNAV